MEFVSLSKLVGQNFVIEEIKPFVWKMWNQEEKKMVTSDQWQEGFRKVYPVTTNKGQLDLSAAQIGSIMEAVADKSALKGKAVAVKSNGKQGMDIRYFFNYAKTEELPTRDINEDVPTENVDIDDIPF